MAKLRWLVVRDFQEIESASFWHDAPEIETGELTTEEIGTEVFFLPAAAHTEKDGSFTNTQRLLQWHHKAVEPKGDCRSELWFMYHLGRRIREKLAQARRPQGPPVLDLRWDYPTEGEIEEPSADAVLREISGWDADGQAGLRLHRAEGRRLDRLRLLDLLRLLRRRRQPDRRAASRAASRAGSRPSGAGRGRRTAASSTTAPPPIPTESRGRSARSYVWWDAGEGKWTGDDVPDFKADMPPDYVPPEGAEAEDALRGDEPFIMQADGRGWLFVPSGLTDGPLPTHYEPHESPFRNPLYGQQANPARERYHAPGEPLQPLRRRARRGRVPLRDDDLPADRAPHRRRACRARFPTSPSSSRRCSAR